jgi:extracellular factor (EF) 3-hydroxypalmitic acid methyl ester biosynthesis protein
MIDVTMDKPSDQQAVAAFRTKDGFEARANILRMAPFLAALEVYHPEVILQTSEVLEEFRIYLGDRLAYSGRAIVMQMVSTGSTIVCEVKLDSAIDLSLLSALRETGQLREQFAGFMRYWQDTYRIRPEYKIVVADIETYLGELRRWLEQIELSLRAAPSGNRAQLEQQVLEEIGRAIVPVINRFFEKFEEVTPQIDAELLSAHQTYFKRHLHPLVLCSPFAYRTFAKPLGYAGDYEIVNMMLRNPFEGSSVFAKIVNLWFLEQPPALAHRNRIAYLERTLLNEAARVARSGRPARVFNLACGPAVEVQRFIAQSPLADNCKFDLLDFNNETLVHVRTVLEGERRRAQRSTALNFINKPVHQLLKSAGKSVERTPEQQYDLIYCAGLFDYLTDPIIQRLLTVLYSWLAPDGLLLATNVDPSNPLRYGMEHLLDWHLIYRNSTHLRALRPSQVAAEDAEVKSELSGVNLFMEVRRSRHV